VILGSRRAAMSTALALALVLSAPAGAEALIPPDTSCRSGTVALTFDDGPHAQNTPRLLEVLRRHRAQVTFYVQGHNAARYPGLLRTMIKDGHAVENHSWDHPRLTSLSDAAVRSQLARTTAAIREATGRTPRFFRPPYGATDGRIRSIARKQGLAQRLWTIDSADWTGISAREITRNSLTGLRKHRRNVILLHDAVVNSPRTIDAVPAIVKGLRKRGYCLVPQQSMMARQKVWGKPRRVPQPSAGSSVEKLVLRLDSPAQRGGRVLVTAVDGSARAGTHYRRSPIWVRFKRGDTEAVVRVRILRVADDHADRRFFLRLSRPDGLRIREGHRRFAVTITGRGPVA